MSFRRIAAMAGLPLVAAIEACAYFMGLTMLALLLTDEFGMDQVAASSTSAWLRGLGLGALLVGGLVGAGIGPQITLVLGVLLSAIGLVLLPFLDASLVMVPIAILALGQGLKRPAIWAIAAQPFGFPREHLRIVSVLLAYVGYNLGAVLASPLAQALREALGLRAVYLTAGGLALLATLLAALVGGAWLLQRDQAAEEQRTPRPPQGSVLMGVGALALLAFLPVLCWNQSWYLQIDLLQQLDVGMSWDLFFALNPVIVIAVAVLLAAVLGALHFSRLRVPAMALVGLGLAIVGLGMLLMVVPWIRTTALAFVAAAILLSIGEALALPPLLSRLTGDAHWRLAPLLAALWLALTGGGGLLLSWLGDTLELPVLRTATGWVGAGSGLLFGLALLILAIPLQRRLFTPPR